MATDSSNAQVEQVKPSKLVEMIDYQDKTVVSRTLIKKPTGTVTLFAFDSDEGLSEHTAPFDALLYLLDGQAEITISGQPHTMCAGEIITLPQGKPHSVRALSRFKMLLTMVRTSVLPRTELTESL
jgi:quercetin dioxygenase-like cupin family protein